MAAVTPVVSRVARASSICSARSIPAAVPFHTNSRTVGDVVDGLDGAAVGNNVVLVRVELNDHSPGGADHGRRWGHTAERADHVARGRLTPVKHVHLHSGADFSEWCGAKLLGSGHKIRDA